MTMSEINNNDVNETKETEETQESTENEQAEKDAMNKFKELPPEEQKAINENCKQYQKEHPEATREELHKYAMDRINKNGETSEDDNPEPKEREKIDDLHRRGNTLAASENLTQEDKQEMYKEISSSDDFEGVIKKYEALEEERAKEKEQEDDELTH